MYFIAVVQSAGGAPSYPNQTTFTANTTTPFPFSGRFKVRITGYDYQTDGDPTTSKRIVVYSRALLNPLMPQVFSFLPDKLPFTGNGTQIRHFNKSGWWEVELSGAIDLTLTTTETQTSVGPFTFLLHLELERLTEHELKHRK